MRARGARCAFGDMIFAVLNEATLPAVVEIEREAFLDEPWTQEMFAEEMANDFSHFITLSSEDGKVLGFGGVRVLAPDAEIMDIAVRSEERGKGLGRALLENLTSCAKDAGAKELFLEVASNNVAALALYQQVGFQPIALRKKYYAGKQDAIVMTKTI